MPSPLAVLTSPIGSVLDRVRDAFDSPRAGTVAVAMLVVVTIGTSVGIIALGAVFDATVDQQITVDNPDRPPESTCETFGDDPDSAFAEECDEPKQIEVDAGEELSDAANGYIHYGLLGVPIWWVAFALALHVGALVAGGSGSVGDSFVIAGWAIGAELLRLGAGIVAIWYTLSNAAPAGSSFEALTTDLVAAITSATGPLLVASAVAIAIQWVVVVGGLEAVHDLDRGPAAGVATFFAAIALLIAAV
ncbi:YIP1 family protein [Halorubrum ezzemoulense]|uniref:YIP1 family protein n=1 Tax=Halorubrum ezzemoulense TaxID=337243 RepID=A0A238V6M8_HALEZ|nr:MULTISPECIES: YIP1 family protein [Halorubrum]MDB2236430.1 YIP1 family protein [Halorubrum ezzemoulense]MDB2241213.1 YIP1 family protein [Halorubrum ezzemoulense]MDB2244912.1 YIP1 family protein [Halorubrum ezzemoulense]MDB2248282.1 YIP1 family protein [Halorubrum ezzemoulense]MDB2251119.1 YIP1 family protein [Halorubrum ezzemoulense]